MSATKPEVKEFLKKSDRFLEPSAVQDFLELSRQMNLSQIKDQLSNALTPILNRLASIEKQQGVIVDLLQKKVDFDPQEQRILNLLETVLKKEF